ncbi:MAG: TIM barrel protein, partial [Verrucomicrobiota bacterium]|nr:TIM barrel protein [Verrucomicrobiota bacterium]
AAHHFNSVSTDPESLIRIINQLPPTVGFNYDPGNIKAVRPDDKNFCLEVINERINYCHLKDWSKKGDGWVAVAIGDDDLDYTPLFENMSYDGVCLIEYEPLHDTKDGIRRSLNYLNKIEERSQSIEFKK